MKVAIIPARGGSKRIPRKNIRPFHGKPVINYSIEAAIQCGLFDEIIVSTDDEEIAKVANASGADTPFLRPSNLADDFVDTTSVIAHAIEWLTNQGRAPDDVCCIYATAPFISPKDIVKCFELFRSEDKDYALPVTSFAFPIQRAVHFAQGNSLAMMDAETFQSRSQDLIEAWHDVAQFYWGKASAWHEKNRFFDDNTVAMKIPRYRAQDIDTPEDWAQAELMYSALQQLDSASQELE